MDVESYDSLFLRIKDSLIYSTDISRIASHFSLALIECNMCVSKALELTTNLLQQEETGFQVSKLCDYIDNAITLLQMLSDFIKNVLESAAMACCSMKPFPITTGNIIMTVFMHCKDSEWIYRHHLKSVETQLKDLFRSCHELQLTYLMTLEKHFIFDLTEKEEQEILIEALNINMKIGEIVQALDIKTMAEQWKAYTVICEKYSNFLVDKNIYNKCTQLFASNIMDNVKTAMESKGDNKSTVRSLKVANFTIKILSRVSNVFKHAITNNYEHVVELMAYIYLHNPAYLKLSSKTQQFINLMLTNILSPTDGLCMILLQDERFLDYVYKMDVKMLETNAFLGHIILITSIIKAVLQKKEDQVLNLVKQKLIKCVYQILPLGHYWFNMELRFQSSGPSSDKYVCLYEHLLTHTVALATTFTSENYTLLEKHMFEAIMGTECYSAVFSSNLWVLLIRTRKDQLASNTLLGLVNIYQKLEKHKSFHNSPQEVHLSQLIGKLFEVSSSEDRRLMSRQIQPRNALWAVLGVSNLPDPVRGNVEGIMLEKFKTSYKELFESQDVTEKEMDNLIQVMKVAATCMFTENRYTVERYVVKLWSKVCHKNGCIQSQDFDTSEAVWYFNYLEGLTALTECISQKLNSASLGKILHNMSTLLRNPNTNLIHLLWDLFCKLTFNRIEDENQHVIDNIFKDTSNILMQGLDTWSKPYLLHKLTKYKCSEHFLEITSAIFETDESLRKEFNLNCDDKSKYNSFEFKQQLISEAHFEYTHKCRRVLNNDCLANEYITQSTKSNFDLGFLFDDEIEEPSRKKAKLDNIEAESIIESLENNTSLLCQADRAAVKNYRNRIVDVIDKLNNIVS